MRLMAFLLVPGLLVDPALASNLTGPLPVLECRMTARDYSRFNQDAICGAAQNHRIPIIFTSAKRTLATLALVGFAGAGSLLSQSIPIADRPLSGERDPKTGWPVIHDASELDWVNRQPFAPFFRPGEIDFSALPPLVESGSLKQKDVLKAMGIKRTDSAADAHIKIKAAMAKIDLFDDIKADDIVLPPAEKTFFEQYKTALREKRPVRVESTGRLNRQFLQKVFPDQTSRSLDYAPVDASTFETYVLDSEQPILYLQFSTTQRLIEHLARPLVYIDVPNGTALMETDQNGDGVLGLEDLVAGFMKSRDGSPLPYMALEYSMGQFVRSVNYSLDLPKRLRKQGKKVTVRLSSEERKVLDTLEQWGYIRRIPKGKSKGKYRVLKNASVIAGRSRAPYVYTMPHELAHAYFDLIKKARKDVIRLVRKHIRNDAEFKDVLAHLGEISNPKDPQIVATELYAYGLTGFAGLAFDWTFAPFTENEVALNKLREILRAGPSELKSILEGLGIHDTDSDKDLLAKFNAPISNASGPWEEKRAVSLRLAPIIRDIARRAQEAARQGTLLPKSQYAIYNRAVLQALFDEATAKSFKGLWMDQQTRDRIQQELQTIGEKYHFKFLSVDNPKPFARSRTPGGHFLNAALHIGDGLSLKISALRFRGHASPPQFFQYHVPLFPGTARSPRVLSAA